MADESETAVKPPAPPLPQMMEGNGNGHEHCSDCENEEENSYSRGGLSPANDTGAKKKKKKQKKKKEKGSETDSAQDQPVKMNSLPAERIQEIQKAIELFSVGQGPAKTMEEASKRSYQFWDTQPVPKLGMYVLSSPGDGEGCVLAVLWVPHRICGGRVVESWRSLVVIFRGWS
ncbi:glycylpeptide N-tetradecanoyltransferase 1 [Leptonychotes weddellii]|uniref:Glycylpeptide N-tetradecanoyltransferase 1 n=1 Tax=Leptonychotes weddellii TaxID=9713 RepID=A0A7F8R0H4_LEPWE|nr:glycylpeptide N-tetradecanoyltransferase 1 [Leptonychotes weddellii]